MGWFESRDRRITMSEQKEVRHLKHWSGEALAKMADIVNDEKNDRVRSGTGVSQRASIMNIV